MNKIKVLHTNGEIEDFKPRLIGQTIIKETGIDEKKANKIQERIINKIRKLKKDGLNEISTNAIRAEVSSQLLKEKEFEAEEDNRSLGMSRAEIYDLIKNPDRSNANQSPSSESVLKYSNDKVFKQIALMEVPKDLREAHLNKFIKIHDLEGLGANIRPHNCFIFDLDWFKRNGLIIDPNDVNAARAHPAKHLSVLLNHALQALQVNSQQTTGGSGFADFSVKIAPFVKDMPYSEIKQNMQNFFYNSSMILISKAQVVFSSIGVDIAIPDYMKEMDAIGPGGIVVGKYKDFEKENDAVVQAILEVMEEGWGEKANPTPFLFPNVIFNLNKEVVNNPDKQDVLLRIHKYIAKYWTPYICNIDIEGSNGASAVMGCRSRLNNNLKTVEDSIYNCGNLAYYTINLPKLGYLAKNKDDFFSLLDKYLKIVDEGLLYRRDMVKKALDEGLMDFHKQKDKKTGRQLYEIERQTLTFGIVGINECLLNLYGYGVKRHIEDAEEILQHISNHAKEFAKENNVRTSVIMSPCESTSSEFADFDKEKYPDIIVNGKKGAYYYTNGHDIPIDDEIDFTEHLENACRLQKYATGGDIAHIWSSGQCDPEALLKTTKMAIENGIGFLSYSGAFTVCKNCGATYSGKLEQCETCGNDNLVIYEKICGYMVPLTKWCDGRLQQEQDRYLQQIK